MTPCKSCADLGNPSLAYLDRGDELPDGARSLVRVDEAFRQCPACGWWFHYMYMPPGAGNVGDREELVRFSDWEMRVLGAILGASNDVTVMAQRLEEAVVADEPSAARKLDDLYAFVARHAAREALMGVLSKWLGHPCAALRLFAVRHLEMDACKGQMPAPVVSALERLLKDESAQIRSIACLALTADAVHRNDWPLVKKMIRQPDPTLRERALWKLWIADKWEPGTVHPRVRRGVVAGLQTLLEDLAGYAAGSAPGSAGQAQKMLQEYERLKQAESTGEVTP